jgi:hypothetical protein
VLIGTETHPLKEAFRQRIMETFLGHTEEANFIKWLPIFAQILLPINPGITERLKEVTEVLVRCMGLGTKGQQISHASVFRLFVHNYITDEAQIDALLTPQVPAFVDLLMANRGAEGIRVSALLGLFNPLQYHVVAK